MILRKSTERLRQEGAIDPRVREGFFEEVTFKLKDEWARDRVRGRKGKG